ncbi:MAG: hypothetical protein AAFY46_17055 [Planctomycetota bacterium]
MKTCGSALIAGFAVSFAGSSAAQLSFSFDEAAFAAGSNASDDYASYTTAGGADVAIPLAGGAATFGDFIYTPIGSEAGFGELEIRAADAGETDAENSLIAFLDGSPDNFSFSIQAVGGPMNAIGFVFFCAASFGGAIVSFDNGESFSIGDQLASPATGFLGISSATPFTTVTFDVADTSSFEGLFIETIYADVIPAPATASLIALSGLAAARRRR